MITYNNNKKIYDLDKTKTNTQTLYLHQLKQQIEKTNNKITILITTQIIIMGGVFIIIIIMLLLTYYSNL